MYEHGATMPLIETNIYQLDHSRKIGLKNIGDFSQGDWMRHMSILTNFEASLCGKVQELTERVIDQKDYIDDIDNQNRRLINSVEDLLDKVDEQDEEICFLRSEIKRLKDELAGYQAND